jgi:hypothetical protein
MLRKRILQYSAVALVVGLVGHGMASAQGEPPADPTLAGDPDISKQAELSIPEQVAQSDTMLARMESIRNSVRRDLEEARQQRDVVKTLCLNDKLNQLDVAVRSATERKRALKLAADRGDKELTSHEFTILSVLSQRAEQLDGEAKQCIGKEVGFVGESSTKGTVDPGMPNDDVTAVPDLSITVPPACASCVQ